MGEDLCSPSPTLWRGGRYQSVVQIQGFFYDRERRTYVIFWSTATDNTEQQRIWFSETSDFQTYSSPRLFFDPGYSVIDATLVLFEEMYYLIFKDERGENRQGTAFKAMHVVTASALHGPYTPQTELITPPLTEGPTVFPHKDRWRMLYDCI